MTQGNGDKSLANGGKIQANGGKIQVNGGKIQVNGGRLLENGGRWRGCTELGSHFLGCYAPSWPVWQEQTKQRAPPRGTKAQESCERSAKCGTLLLAPAEGIGKDIRQGLLPQMHTHTNAGVWYKAMNGQYTCTTALQATATNLVNLGPLEPSLHHMVNKALFQKLHVMKYD